MLEQEAEEFKRCDSHKKKSRNNLLRYARNSSHRLLKRSRSEVDCCEIEADGSIENGEGLDAEGGVSSSEDGDLVFNEEAQELNESDQESVKGRP